MRVTVKRITRGYDKKLSFPGPGDVMHSVTAPVFVTVEVEHDPDKENVEEVVTRVGRRLYKVAREISLSDLERDYGEGVRNPARVPRVGGRDDG